MNMRDLTWLKRCFYTAALMYGMYPYEVLEALYAQGADDKLNKDEVFDFSSRLCDQTLSIDRKLPQAIT